jgi:putative transposase
VKREADKWYACFNVECQSKPLPQSTEEIGLDVGLSAFATLSDGTEIENPRHYREAQAKLRRAQRKVARRKRGSHNRQKATLELQRTHAHIRNQRADFHHKVARTMVNRYGLIAVEDLNVKGLASGFLAKSVNDAGWSSFITKLADKAAEAGRVLVKVDPRGTSQTCLCGAHVPKTLKLRWHQCGECGLSAPRDHVSAQLILGLGRSLCVATSPLGLVTQEAA